MSLGGAERQLFYLVSGLRKYGINSHVVTLYPGGEFWDLLQQKADCKIYSLDRKGRFDFSVIFKLAKYVRKNKIDLLQGWMPPCNTFSMLAAALTRRPVILGIRTSNMIYRERGGNLYNKLDSYLSKHLASKVISNSHSGKEYHQKIGFPSNKMIVIPNGITTEDLVDGNKACNARFGLKLAMVSRIDYVKNHMMALEACKILKDKGVIVELNIYGQGEHELENQLYEYVSINGLQEYVHFCGWTAETNKALSSVDVFVSTSSYGEGMSNSLMEAMERGLIIISTDVGDAHLLLNGEYGKAGYIVEPGNSAALAETIIQISENKDEAKKRADLARAIVTTNFGISKMVLAYSELYKNVVAAG